jgi:sugar lactone lactonase YvrE
MPQENQILTCKCFASAEGTTLEICTGDSTTTRTTTNNNNNNNCLIKLEKFGQ